MTGATSVWLRPERGSRGRPSQWTRSNIADVGIRIADHQGLAAVTMRSVATELGTAAASLYRIVDSRDQVLELMADRVIGEFDYSTLAALDDPRIGLLNLSRQARGIYGRHSWLLTLPSNTPTLGPCAMDYLDHALGVLSTAPTTTREKLESIAIVSGLVRVLLLSEAPARHSTTPNAGWQVELTNHLMAAALRDSRPHLSAAMASVDRDVDISESFDRVMLRVISGLLSGHGS